MERPNYADPEIEELWVFPSLDAFLDAAEGNGGVAVEDWSCQSAYEREGAGWERGGKGTAEEELQDPGEDECCPPLEARQLRGLNNH